jgi:hypothetical protein
MSRVKVITFLCATLGQWICVKQNTVDFYYRKTTAPKCFPFLKGGAGSDLSGDLYGRFGGGEGEGAEGPIEVGGGSEGVREMDRNEK